MKVFQTFLVLFIIFLYTTASLARQESIYSIQIYSGMVLKDAKQQARYISNIIPLPVRLEKIGPYYVIRAGLSEKSADLKSYLDSIEEAGYSQAFIRKAYYLKERVLLEPGPPSEKEKNQPGFSKLPQEKELREDVLQIPEELLHSDISFGYGGKYYSGKAWEYFNDGNYNQAIKLFNFAVSFPETELDAKLGLAYCYLKKKKIKKSIFLLEELVNKSYLPKDVFPSLMTLLIKKRYFKKAKFYLKGLKRKERKKWERKIERELIGIGWRYFQKGKYNLAIINFSNLISSPATGLEAKLGLAFCYVQQKNTEKAIPLLKELAKKEYKSKNVASAIVPLLFEKGDYNEALKYLKNLKEKEREKWERLIQDHEMRNKFSRAQNSGDLKALKGLIKLYKKEIKRCKMPELFNNAAQIFAIRGRRKGAVNIYQNLLNFCSNRWDLRPGIFYGLKDILSASDMVLTIQKELKRPSLPPDYQKQMVAFESDLYKGIIDTLEPSSIQIKGMADKILVFQPDDPFTQAALAWWYYYNEGYNTSYKMFLKLNSRFPEEKGDKLKGLVLSLARLGRLDEAIKEMEEAKIEDNKLRRRILKEVLSLVDTSILQTRILAEKVLAITPNDSQALTSLAWWNYHQGEYETAYKMFLNLYRKYPEKKSKANGLVYTMVKLDKFDEALKLFDEAKIENDTLKRNILRSKLSLLYPSSPEVKTLAEKILAMDPEDLSTQTVLAWWYFHQGEYKTAHEKFQKLYQKDPQKKGYASGLINTLSKLGDFENALKISNQLKAKDEGIKKLKGGLYFNIAASAYKKEEYRKAEMYLKKSLSFAPQNSGAQSLLIWSLFKQDKLDDALHLALSRYERKNDPKRAKNILLILSKMGLPEDALLFASSFRKKEDDVFKKITADYYFKRKWPIKAAQTYSHSDTSYYNVDKPWFELNPFLREKSGTKGRSRLTEYAYPFSFHYPLFGGRKLSFHIRPTVLNSGQAPPSPQQGSFFKNIPQQNELVTSLTAVVPQIMFEQEGEIAYTGQIGTTFIGGPISSLPTFFLQAKGQKWKFSIHQSTKDSSILSYAGQQDPYSSKKWGRLLKTGAEGVLSFTPFPTYWFAVKGGYDYIWGHNIWANQSVQVSSALGKSFSFKFLDFSLGYSSSGKLYDHNTDFYTFGHGGYFSPDIFYNSGPFISFNSKRYRSYWFKASYSLGFSHFESKTVPRFPLNPEISKTNAGTKESNISSSYRVEAHKLFTPHWAGGGYFDWDSTSNFKKTVMGLSLRYYLSPRSRFLPEKR